MQIEFGCGETPTKKGFKTCDIRDLPGVDFVCPAWEINKYIQNNSVDEIFSRHFFEHLTFIQGETQLEVWHKILKPGGKMEMILPNIDFHISQWINLHTVKGKKHQKQLDHAKAGFWGWQREGEVNMWDVHKSGYNFTLLEEVLIRKGFKNIENLTDGKHLWVICYK